MRLAHEVRNDTAKSIWIIGGDGWAYDIGFGGLDHILASGANVNILVLDSQVYSNTGGQTSKATPKGAVAKFSAGGKRRRKKELGLLAMTYADVFVTQVALGADKQHFLRAVTEAEAYQGVSLIIAYAPCIAHGFPMQESMLEEKRAVDSGFWHLYRYNPSAEKKFSLDSKPPILPLRDFLLRENRFASLARSQPETAERLFQEAEQEAVKRYEFYEKLSKEI